jgi:hypothetical protein
MTNLTIDTEAPAMPQAPAGHFWRVTNLVWKSYPEVGPFQSHSDEDITVELHQELVPTRFRKRERSLVVATEEVSLISEQNASLSAAQLAQRTAEKILAERAEAAERHARIERVLGDYR